MTFSDEDLKQVKDQIKTGWSSLTTMPGGGLDALLARLEAAELILENGVSLTHFEDCDKIEHHDWKCTCGSEERWEAWRKKAGK